MCVTLRQCLQPLPEWGCAQWGHAGWQDEDRLVTLALAGLVAIAVKNAFSSRWFWSLVKLWLVLRTGLCVLLGKLLLCCGWSSLLFHGALLYDLFAVGTGQTDSKIWSLLCHFLAPSKGFVKACDRLAKVRWLGLESLLQAAGDHKYCILSWT